MQWNHNFYPPCHPLKYFNVSVSALQAVNRFFHIFVIAWLSSIYIYLFMVHFNPSVGGRKKSTTTKTIPISFIKLFFNQYWAFFLSFILLKKSIFLASFFKFTWKRQGRKGRSIAQVLYLYYSYSGGTKISIKKEWQQIFQGLVFISQIKQKKSATAW